MEIAMRQHMAEVARGVMVCACVSGRTCSDECAFISIACACAVARKFEQEAAASEFSWEQSVAQESPTRPFATPPAASMGPGGSPQSAGGMKYLLQDRVARRHDRARHGPTYDQLTGGQSRSAHRPAEPTTPRRNKDATPLDFYGNNNSAQRYPVEAMLRSDTITGPPPSFDAPRPHPREHFTTAYQPQIDPAIVQTFARDPAPYSSARTYGFDDILQPRSRSPPSEESPSDGLFQRPITRIRAETVVTPPTSSYNPPPRAAYSYEAPTHTYTRNLVFERSHATERELPPLPTEVELPNGSRPYTTILPDMIDDPAELAHARTAAAESYARPLVRQPMEYDPLNPRPLPPGSQQRFVSAGGDLPLHMRPEVTGPMRFGLPDHGGFSADADDFFTHIQTRNALDRVRQETFDQILQPTIPAAARGRGSSAGQSGGGRTRDVIRRMLRKNSEMKDSDVDR